MPHCRANWRGGYHACGRLDFADMDRQYPPQFAELG
jgi:hypothetical protein